MFDQENLVIKLYENGTSIRIISKTFDLTELQIYTILKNNNVTYRDLDKRYEREQTIVNLYLDGMPIIEISRSLNVDRHLVSRYLEKNKIQKTKYIPPLTLEQESKYDNIVSLYQAGKSLKEIAKELNISPAGACLALRKRGIQRRAQHQKGHSKGTSKNRKYFFDLSYFSKIDTEEKAYWLGFLYADGYVTYKGVSILALQEKDKDHLDKFRKAIKADDIELQYSAKTKSYRICLSSVEFADNLMNLGCVQAKSLILKFPSEEQVPNHLIHHFMRGYFDGDGCMYICDKYTMAFSVIGTKEFLDVYEKILLENCKNKTKTKRQKKDLNKNTEYLTYSGRKRIQEIYNFLYKDATVYLERKREKFITAINSRLETNHMESQDD